MLFLGFGLGIYSLAFAFVLHNFAKESGYSYAGGVEKILLGIMIALFALGPLGFVVSLFF
jgi:hypothetical protein